MAISFDVNELVWGQKYRPNCLKDVILPEKFKQTLINHVAGGRIPSFTFYSPSAGTGKTTTAFALCHDLHIKPLYINASLDNSIDNIRTKVFQYATTASLLDGDALHKVVILDEADRISEAGQDSLKGLIEQVSKKCSFIITTNRLARIDERLLSRCPVIDYTYTPEEQKQMSTQMMMRCFEILTLEGVTFDKKVVAMLVGKYAPDNRLILNMLQQYSSETNKNIDSGILAKLQGADTQNLIAAMKGQKYDIIKAWVQNNCDRVGDDIYDTLHKNLSPLVVAQSEPEMFIILNNSQRYHSLVPDRFVHFLALITELMMALQFKP